MARLAVFLQIVRDEAEQGTHVSIVELPLLLELSVPHRPGNLAAAHFDLIFVRVANAAQGIFEMVARGTPGAPLLASLRKALRRQLLLRVVPDLDRDRQGGTAGIVRGTRCLEVLRERGQDLCSCGF